MFTRATIKVSYCTTRNIKAHFAAHNKKILNCETPNTEGCNCRNGENSKRCPLDGNCLVESVVYKETVTTNQPSIKAKTYHGMTQDTFKQKYYGHTHDFKNKDKYGTTLSRHIWKIKDIKSRLSENAQNNFKWNIKWQIKEMAPAYKTGNKDCKLCTSEKYHILNEDDQKSLNLRSELLSKCRHKAKWTLGKLLT